MVHARPTGPVHRHFGQCVYSCGRSRIGLPCGAGLRGCGHVTRLSRGHPPIERRRQRVCSGRKTRGADMIEAVMFWNEPNNQSHWDFEVDPDWRIFADMLKLAADAVAAENPQLIRVLGGISPIDANFIRNMQGQGVLDHLNVVAVHGFPLDWNHWTIHEWPDKLEEIHAVTDLPVWISEIGVSSFGAEEVQEWGLRRSAELLIGGAPRIHWSSLYY